MINAWCSMIGKSQNAESQTEARDNIGIKLYEDSQIVHNVVEHCHKRRHLLINSQKVECSFHGHQNRDNVRNLRHDVEGSKKQLTRDREYTRKIEDDTWDISRYFEVVYKSNLLDLS